MHLRWSGYRWTLFHLCGGLVKLDCCFDDSLSCMVWMILGPGRNLCKVWKGEWYRRLGWEVWVGTEAVRLTLVSWIYWFSLSSQISSPVASIDPSAAPPNVGPVSITNVFKVGGLEAVRGGFRGQWKIETGPSVSSWTPAYSQAPVCPCFPHFTPIFPSLLLALAYIRHNFRSNSNTSRLTSFHNHSSSDPYNKCVTSLRVVLLLWWNL